MNGMDQMLDVVKTMDVSFTKAPQAPAQQEAAAPDRFETVLREKHQEAAGRTDEEQPETKLEGRAEAGPDVKPQGGAQEAAEEIPDEQYVLLAAMLMQPRPQIVYTEPEPEAVTQVVKAVGESETPLQAQVPALDGAAVTETVPEGAQSVEQPLVEAPMEAPVGAPMQIPVERSQEPSTAVQPERPVERKAVQAPVEQQEQPVLEERPVEVVEVRQATMQRQMTDEEPETPLDSRMEIRTEQSGAKEEEAPVVEGAWTESLFQDVRAVPVKVAAPEAPVDLEALDAAEQLGAKILDAAANGDGQIQIHLRPEGLGELNVTIARDEAGTLRVALHTADPKVAELLQRHSDGLQTALSGAAREVEVEIREPQAGQQHQPQFMDPNGENGRQQQPHQEQHQRQERDGSTQDFIQKLRLGLTDLGQAV